METLKRLWNERNRFVQDGKAAKEEDAQIGIKVT